MQLTLSGMSEETIRTIINANFNVIAGIVDFASGKILTASAFDPSLFGTNIVNDPVTSKISLATDDTSNLARNGGFEFQDNQWTLLPGTTISNSTAYSGTYSAEAIGPNTGLFQAVAKCKPGDQFHLSVYYKNVGGTGDAQSIIRFLDSNGSLLQDFQTDMPKLSSWANIDSVIATAPLLTASVEIYPVFTGSATGTWFVDSVLLTRVYDYKRISSLAASSIDPTLVVNGVQNQIQAQQIASVDAQTITNQLAHSQISSIDAQSITINKIVSSQLDTTSINVGGGGSKPNQFGIYDSSNLLIGWIGKEVIATVAYYGAYFQTMGIGGSDITSPSIYSDSNGLVSLTNISSLSCTGAITISGNAVATQAWVTTQLSSYPTTTFLSANYVTSTALTAKNYATQTFVTTQGYINSSTLTSTLTTTLAPYATQTYVNSQGYVTTAVLTTTLSTYAKKGTYNVVAGAVTI